MAWCSVKKYRNNFTFLVVVVLVVVVAAAAYFKISLSTHIVTFYFIYK
jgi:hypothetical protein